MSKFNNINIKESLLKGSFNNSVLKKEGEKTVDTIPMIVTLEQLQPSFVLPRQKRNPKYNEIKESIAMRGLDSPPGITKRPGENTYVISDGGNTRLEILNELWKETKDERFFRINCLFKPWVSEIHSLVGHLAENDLHSDFTFIEKAIGITKAREILEKSKGSLSQRLLAEELQKIGYPISQSHIVKMEQTIKYLLPCIPDVLYDGLGRHQIEQLISIRSILEQAYDRYKELEDNTTFELIFEQVLLPFNIDPTIFSIDTVIDELIGAFAKELDVDYNTLLADVVSKKVGNKPAKKSIQNTELDTNKNTQQQKDVLSSNRGSSSKANKLNTLSKEINHNQDSTYSDLNDYSDIYQESNISSSNSNNVLSDEIQQVTHSIQQEVSDLFSAREKSLTRSEDNDEFEPIPDIWRLDALHINSIDHLRAMIGRIASDLAISHQLEEHLKPSSTGIGFIYTYTFGSDQQTIGTVASLVNLFLESISTTEGYPMMFDNEHLFGNLVIAPVIDDKTLIRMFRMIRAVRQLNDLLRERG